MSSFLGLSLPFRIGRASGPSKDDIKKKIDALNEQIEEGRQFEAMLKRPDGQRLIQLLNRKRVAWLELAKSQPDRQAELITKISALDEVDRDIRVAIERIHDRMTQLETLRVKHKEL